MVRPERDADDGVSCCIELTGASPVAVSAEAPRSRPRAREEIPSSERGIKSPRQVVRLVGGEQVRRPSIKRTLQPREISNRKVGWPSRSCHGEGNRLHLQVGWVQDARGVERTACGDSSMRNRRDPSRLLTSSEGDPYKPMAKAERAGKGELCSSQRESFALPNGRALLFPTGVRGVHSTVEAGESRSREGTLLW